MDETAEDKFNELLDTLYPNGILEEEQVTIEKFISLCSLSDFEKLKDLEYDMSGR
jgi:hypothetical protein